MLPVRGHRVAVVRLDLVLHLGEVRDLLVRTRYGVLGGGLADAERRGAGDDHGGGRGAEPDTATGEEGVAHVLLLGEPVGAT